MKEKKLDSFFIFKRQQNRNSYNFEERRKEESKLKRASWSSFSSIQPSQSSKLNENKFEGKSKSIENLNSISAQINAPIGYNQMSSRSTFSSFGSSHFRVDSPSLSDKNSITSILENASIPCDSNISISDINQMNQFDMEYQRKLSYSSVPFNRSIDDILEEEERNIKSIQKEKEKEFLTSSCEEKKTNYQPPKILFAHKKTPDLPRKTKQQILVELEEAKLKGSISKSPVKVSNKKNSETKKKNLTKDEKQSKSIYNFFSRFDQRKDKPTTTSGQRIKIKQSISNPICSSTSFIHNNGDFRTLSGNYLDSQLPVNTCNSESRIHKGVSNTIAHHNDKLALSSGDIVSRQYNQIPKYPDAHNVSAKIIKEDLRKSFSLPKVIDSIKTDQYDVEETYDEYDSSINPFRKHLNDIFEASADDSSLLNDSKSSNDLDDTISINSISSSDSDELRQQSITEDLVEDTIKQFDLIANNNCSFLKSDNSVPTSTKSDTFNDTYSLSQFNNNSSLGLTANPYFLQDLKPPTKTESYLSKQFSSDLINDIIMEEDSDCEVNENEGETYDEESSNYEKRLENELEVLDSIDDEPIWDDTERMEEPKPNISKRLNKSNLKVDVNKASSSPQATIQQLHRNRLLRHISEESFGSNGEVVLRPKSSSSTDSASATPKSPIIDIDDAFKQRQKELESNPVDDMTKVKSLTQRLNLPTRRPSYLEWINGIKYKYESKNTSIMDTFSPQVVEGDEIGKTVLSDEERKENLKKAMLWLKEELTLMREQDQKLANQLWHLQLEMQKIRLLRSCNTHQSLVEEVSCDNAEQKAYMNVAEVTDTPAENSISDNISSVLKNIGVTRWNISNRRFSLR